MIDGKGRPEPVVLQVGMVQVADVPVVPVVVGAAVEQMADGGITVAPGAADLLVIRLDRGRQPDMHDPAHVLTVDPHPKGDGRHHDIDIAAGEAVLRAAGGMLTDINGAPIGYGKSAGKFLNPEFLAMSKDIHSMIFENAEDINTI